MIKVCTMQLRGKTTEKKTSIWSESISFLQIFSSSHTISIILYSNKHFFVKTSSFFIIFNTVYIFFNNSMSFFHHFSFATQQSFFRRKRICHSFFQLFIFLFKIKYHSISRKKQEWKTIFFFFQKFKTHFFDKSKRIFFRS